MAKDQNLSLNPTKISGVCGRLMCCLKNEEETYEYLNSKLPAVGDTVTTASGLQGEVSSVNVLRQRVKVLVDVDDEKELQEYDVNELKFKPRKKKEKGAGRNDRNEKGEKSEKGGKKNKDPLQRPPEREGSRPEKRPGKGAKRGTDAAGGRIGTGASGSAGAGGRPVRPGG